MKKDVQPISSTLVSAIDNYPPPQKHYKCLHLEVVAEAVVLEILKQPKHNKDVLEVKLNESNLALNYAISCKKNMYENKIIPLIHKCIKNVKHVQETQTIPGTWGYAQLERFIQSMEAIHWMRERHQKVQSLAMLPL